MRIWRRRKPDREQDTKAVGSKSSEATGQPERLWPVIDVFEADRKRKDP
jgi:hypothetical protein